MRSFFIVLVIVGLGFFYLRQKHNEATTPTPPAQSSVKTTHTNPTPAPRGVASEHNWMKRSLDRAKDVTEQSRARTSASQDP